MALHWETTVLTTCALDYMRWENYYPEGDETVGNTVIKRFLVNQPRDVPLFNSFSGTLRQQGENATLEDQEQWMRLQGPMSQKLLEFISDNASNYDAYIFFGYLYATTYFGLPLVSNKSWLVPLGHDEWPIYFSMWDRLFALPRGLLFQTPEELLFLQKRFGRLELSGPVTGIGVEPPAQMDERRFRQKYRIEDPFILYVGRIDASKGCSDMFVDFCRLKAETPNLHKLVLIGPEVLPVPYHKDIIYLGLISEQEKWDAIAACDWLINPSPHESLSIVLLEAWAAGRPVIVSAKSEVMLGHCRRSNGGLWYDSFEELAAICCTVTSQLRQTLGKQGQEYVKRCYSWSRIESCYLKALMSNLENPNHVESGAIQT